MNPPLAGLTELSEPTKRFANKRIALVFDYKVSYTTGQYCRKALQTFCEIELFKANEIHEIPANGFDLYLQIDDSSHHIFRSDLKPSALWIIDTHITYNLDLIMAKSFDFVFAAQRDGAQKLIKDGLKNVYWLPLACDPEIHGKHNIPKVYDLAFVGHPQRARNDLINLLKKRYPRSFFGTADFREMGKIYSQARIVFNMGIKNDVNMRIFEGLCSGTMLVTDDLSGNGLDLLFQNGKHLITYKNAEDALNKMDRWLGNEVEREKIARCGMIEVEKKHTYLHRMWAVLDIVFGSWDIDSRKCSYLKGKYLELKYKAMLRGRNFLIRHGLTYEG